MNINDLKSRFKSALKQVVNWTIIQPTQDWDILNQEKPLIRDQVRDPRYWNLAFSYYAFIQVPLSIILTSSVVIAQAAVHATAPTVVSTLSAATKEIGCAGILAGVVHIHDTNGSPVPPREMLSGTCRNSGYARSMRYIVSKLG